MNEELKQTIKDQFVKLPRETQEVIGTFNWLPIMGEIGKKYLLDESETNDLGVEVSLVLLGLTDGASLADSIEDNVGTSKDEATKIAEEVLQKIFTPMGNMLEEKVKKNMKDKNPTWDQSLNFILSGGNYSSFLIESNKV